MPASLNTLVTFNGPVNGPGGDGAYPAAGLISDAAGDLFGTTDYGGAYGYGTVFEIANTASGYGAPVTLGTFTSQIDSGDFPQADLISDAAGDLFGTTAYGGADGYGTVFEIANTASGYGAPVILASFNGLGNGNILRAGLISDAAGDLFGTTENGGSNSDGTVFEIAKTASGYGAPMTLVTFNGIGNGKMPEDNLSSDAAGDLFGTTYYGGADGYGTVFEIASTASGYGAPVTLVTFNGVGNGAYPYAGLISDAVGDLFGTTENGGSNSDGTVVEIVKTASGYGAPATLVTFNGLGNGSVPQSGLISDAAGDLFGTTNYGGAYGYGTVFEIAKTASGYGALTTLINFNGLGNGKMPEANLSSDAAGDLFGTTFEGGATDYGTVFEITDSGFFALAITSAGRSTDTRTQTISGTIDVADAGSTVSIYDGSTLIGTATPSVNGAWSATVSLLSTPGAQSITVQATDAAGVLGTSSPVTYTFLHAVASDFTGNGTSDVLLQNGSTVVDWLMQNGLYSTGNVLTAGATGYTTVGTGDFIGNGTADVLLQNGGTVVDWIMSNGQYQSGNILTTGATGYNVVGTGDFTGNGVSDVLLQNGGTVVDWIMSNSQYQSGNVLTSGATGYTVVGTGDFTGNGTDDVLLQNGGTVVDWLMQNGQYQSGNVLTTGATGYTVVGTGDFTGNGTSDVLLQNGGTVVDWILQNGQYQSGNVITTAATGFTVVGTGDYNGDGTSDVLLQNGGTVVDWIMKNGQYSSGNVVTTGATGFKVSP